MVQDKSSKPGTPDRDADLLDSVAFSLEAPRDLLPLMPRLLADLPSLSSAPDEVITAIGEAGLSSGARMLDLGCGRGEFAILAAERFQAEVTGVDAFVPFIEAARLNAHKAEQDGRCTFVAGDIRDVVRRGHGHLDHDAVLLLALGPVLGTHGETVAALRALIRPGGLMVIDDGYLEEGEEPPDGLEDYAPLAETEQRLTAHGDRIVARLERTAGMQAFNRTAMDRIRARAAEVKRDHPERAQLIDDYVKRQEYEFGLLEGPVVGAVWILEKTG